MLIGFVLIAAAAILAGILPVRLAVHALPACCAYLAATAVHASGAGWLLAFAAAGLAAVATLALAQVLLAFSRSNVSRAAVGLAFAPPAGIAGFHAMHGIAVAVIPPSVLLEVLPPIAAIVIAAMAWRRLGSGPFTS